MQAPDIQRNGPNPAIRETQSRLGEFQLALGDDEVDIPFYLLVVSPIDDLQQPFANLPMARTDVDAPQAIEAGASYSHYLCRHSQYPRPLRSLSPLRSQDSDRPEECDLSGF